MKIRPLTKIDYESVKRIYEEGLATGMATFETEAPEWETWDKKNLPFCRFVIDLDGQIVGWVALSPVSTRAVYKGVAEVSIYVSDKYRGQGLGKKLFDHLMQSAEPNGIWTLQSNVFSENKASLNLHLRAGFRIVGVREKIGQLNGIWKDNILLEKRFKLKS